MFERESIKDQIGQSEISQNVPSFEYLGYVELGNMRFRGTSSAEAHTLLPLKAGLSIFALVSVNVLYFEPLKDCAGVVLGMIGALRVAITKGGQLELYSWSFPSA